MRYFLNTESLFSKKVQGSITAHLVFDVLERGPLRREAPSECLRMNFQCDGDIIELRYIAQLTADNVPYL